MQEYRPDDLALLRELRFGPLGVRPWLTIGLPGNDELNVVVDLGSAPFIRVCVVGRNDGATRGVYSGRHHAAVQTTSSWWIPPPPPVDDDEFRFSPIGVAVRRSNPSTFYVVDQFNGRLDAVDIATMSCVGSVRVFGRGLPPPGTMALGVQADDAADRLIVGTTSGVVVFERNQLV